MNTEIASQIILVNLKNISGESRNISSAAVDMNRIIMWLVPQKAEHDEGYEINRSYFEILSRNALDALLSQRYISLRIDDGIEDGDPQMFSLTDKGAKYAEELAIISEMSQ